MLPKDSPILKLRPRLDDDGTMNVLDISEPGATAWLEAQLPKLHLLLGDSVARDCQLESRIRRDEFFSLARGGDSWSALHRDLPDRLSEWVREISARGSRPGSAVVWMTGNDIYNKYTGLASFTEDGLITLAEYARDVTRALLDVAEGVVVLGPLPRLDGEINGARWEQTSAFHLERRLLHGLPDEAQFVPLGRQLTKKWAGRHSCIDDCARWYAMDGVHLSADGYARLADIIPIWLTMGAAAL
ncbi:hypothetical protein FJT64_026668 [Amphibalanus amphitrite]|uniref:SGNH hydrolase-type esterase domain-containing protein n=1 Tax=Amphibalanus amphitrite TaxID=1232801 RepID=A0A6A4WDL1_AMPAM|nr:hypothetical protein FJT64_026668 [Amphibalanus amphitrite]